MIMQTSLSSKMSFRDAFQTLYKDSGVLGLFSILMTDRELSLPHLMLFLFIPCPLIFFYSFQILFLFGSLFFLNNQECFEAIVQAY